MSIIECKALTKEFRSTKALNNFSCKIEKNTITGLIGRNGAGKTTLLKMIAGYWRQTSGEIKVLSEEPFNHLTVSANVIFIHDQLNLPTALNLQEILEVMAGFYKNWDRELAQRLFDYFSFHPMQYYSGLSKGMKSTFNMILGLAARTPLTLFDEPTTGMDQAVRQDFYRALLKDYIAYPRTIILSSHHLDEIEDLLENILLMKQGQELLHMSIADFREWAVGLEGKTSEVKHWAQDKEVIFTKDNGLGQSYLVVKNKFTDVELRQAKLAGMTIAPVSSSDLCVYLTSKTKGGIDDVFNKG